MPARKKLLLLDDDEDLLEVYREMLSRLPSQPEIHTANSGARAIALLESEPFTLLLSDLAMLFERNMNDIPLPVILQVLDGKVVRMDFRFGISAADLLKEIPVENVLVTPQEAQAWMDSIR